jgi:transglutaminase-like putative cysteine protease
VQHLPNEVLTYLLPSRYCESECFFEMASEIVAGVAPGYDQVACDLRLDPARGALQLRSTHVHMAATDVNQRREGVCRDLAHLGIALCRGLCIPARMVVGYLHELAPMDLHAWFEAWVGGRWYTFDATQDAPRGGRVPWPTDTMPPTWRSSTSSGRHWRRTTCR